MKFLPIPEPIQRGLGFISFFGTIALVILGTYYESIRTITIWVLPFTSAYFIEFGIKVADDLYIPNKNFALALHAIVTSLLGVAILLVSALVLGEWHPFWQIPIYLLTAFVINKVNLVCTKAEAASLEK